MVTWTWAEGLLASARNYWLCTSGPEGAPHAMPVWAVWADGAAVFSTAPESRKARNLKHDPRAVAHVEVDRGVVILEGLVEETAIDEVFADAYAAKYDHRPVLGSPDDEWFRLRPRVAYAWLEPEYARTATRFAFD
jgi:nitroimidazol reductase NimA-like FMN-containing flavoprotein (pyridoxamine 5'-phosphate oxidase superfamily)